MVKDKILISLSIVLVIFISGCSNSTEKIIPTESPIESHNQIEAKNEYRDLYSTALLEIDILNDKIDELDIKIVSLNELNDKLKARIKELINQINNQPQAITVSSAFEWTKLDDWDEIRITQYYKEYGVVGRETTIVSTKDGNLLFLSPAHMLPDVLEFGHPVDPGEHGVYRYEFIKDSKTYTIDIYDSAKFSYEGKFYYCLSGSGAPPQSLMDYGRAFIADKDQTEFNSTRDYLSFIYNCSICKGEKIYGLLYSNPRHQINAKALKTFTVIDKPENTQDIAEEKRLEILTFYYNGETLQLHIYMNYVNIKYLDDDIWLAKYENNELQPVEFLLRTYGAS